MKSFPMALLIAAAVQVSCQIFKFVVYSIRDKKITFSYLSTAGGMPSSHSAFVTSVTATIGLITGFYSELFTVSAVFSAIVIYDAYRLRGTVQRQSIVLNKVIKQLNIDEKKPLNEMVGHSMPEIVAGIFVGLFFAGLYTKLFAMAGWIVSVYGWM